MMAGRKPNKAAPAGATGEVGVNINWNYGGNRTEFVPKLSGLYGLQRLEEMTVVDETVGAMMWGVESALMQVPWAHQAQLDGKDTTDEEAVRLASWADGLLEDMEHTMSEHVQEALSFIWAGFAPCEIVLKQRQGGADSRFDDGYYGFKQFTLRDQQSVTEWTYDDKRNLTGMRQLGWDGQSGTIPIWKLLHYRTSRRLNRPEGYSMLTNAYRAYYLKQKIQDSEAIGIDRDLCGLPLFRIPMSDLEEAAGVDEAGKATPRARAAMSRIEAAQKATRDMRFNEAGGLVLPSDPYMDNNGQPTGAQQYDFEIVTTAGQRSIDARTAAKDYDRAIARLLMMQFLHLGDRSGGSHALSENQSDLALKSMRALAVLIAGEYNRKALRLIWLINGFDMHRIPKLEPGPISAESLDQLGIFLDRIAQAGPLFEAYPELLEMVLTMSGLRQARARMDPNERQRTGDRLAAAGGLGSAQPDQGAAQPDQGGGGSGGGDGGGAGGGGQGTGQQGVR